MDAAEALARVEAELERSRSTGLLGPGPVRAHVEHALGFAACIPPAEGTVVDLGSGGGVPGLVLAVVLADRTFVFVDAGRRRCDHLEGAIARLGLTDRCRVVCGRAEVVGRIPEHREMASAVVARAFGPPPVTAECATGLVRVGGVLVVSEPPAAVAEPAVLAQRWPESRLAELGMGAPETRSAAGAQFVVIPKVGAAGPRWPRRDGQPSKRPLW